jgi:hypothetical protein
VANQELSKSLGTAPDFDAFRKTKQFQQSLHLSFSKKLFLTRGNAKESLFLRVENRFLLLLPIALSFK